MYEIKFLSNEDFDNLPKEVTKGSRIDDSLGFYNPDLGKAYIRFTASNELNKYLLNHEFEHMLENEATDVDENGIRHKKKGGVAKFFDTIFNPVTWVNPERQSALVMPLTASEGLGSMGQSQEQPQQESMNMNPFLFSQSGSNFQGSQGSQSGYESSNSLPESSFSGLNSNLNQSSQPSPFASDQERFRYGAPAGRLSF